MIHIVPEWPEIAYRQTCSNNVDGTEKLFDDMESMILGVAQCEARR